MSQKIDSNITQAIVEIAVFLESSNDSTINRDAAVQALEQLAATLQAATLETRYALNVGFINAAENYKGEQAAFVENLALTLGLVAM